MEQNKICRKTTLKLGERECFLQNNTHENEKSEYKKYFGKWVLV